MNKLITALLASTFAFSTAGAMAADTPDNAPPVHKEAHKSPESTNQGNYLENQPDENGATGNSSNNAKGTGKKNAKATNIEKGKNHTDSPESGGAKVDSK